MPCKILYFLTALTMVLGLACTKPRPSALQMGPQACEIVPRLSRVARLLEPRIQYGGGSAKGLIKINRSSSGKRYGQFETLYELDKNHMTVFSIFRGTAADSPYASDVLLSDVIHANWLLDRKLDHKDFMVPALVTHNNVVNMPTGDVIRDFATGYPGGLPKRVFPGHPLFDTLVQTPASNSKMMKNFVADINKLVERRYDLASIQIIPIDPETLRIFHLAYQITGRTPHKPSGSP